METPSNNPGLSPPEEKYIPLDAPESQWPKIIGVISLIYALGGLLCSVGLGISSFFMEALMKLGGMNVVTPPIIKFVGAGSAVLLLGLGIVMMSGAVSLLRRQRSGVKMLKIWAFLRVVLIVIGITTTFVTAPAQIQLQRSIMQAQEERMRESGRTIPSVELSDQQIWRKIIIQNAIFVCLVAIYPTFLIFYLSGRRVTNEIEQWR